MQNEGCVFNICQYKYKLLLYDSMMVSKTWVMIVMGRIL